MNKFEVIKYILHYIEANEINKANELIEGKQREFLTSEVRSRRFEINEIIKMMHQIDIELLQFKLKKMQLIRLCPDYMMTSLEVYMESLVRKREQLVVEKKRIAKVILN